MMEDGYPDTEELAAIEKWDYKDAEGLVDYLTDIWWNADTGVVRKGNILELHTWGWSGNEEIIGALTRSTFWSVYWMKTERGGHYYFELKEIK